MARPGFQYGREYGREYGQPGQIYPVTDEVPLVTISENSHKMKTAPQLLVKKVALKAQKTGKSAAVALESETPEWLKVLHRRWGSGIALLDPGPAPTPFDGSTNPQDAWD